jgi:hypothetical protein
VAADGLCVELYRTQFRPAAAVAVGELQAAD